MKYQSHDCELWLGDSVKLMREIPPASFDEAIFSPPFASLYCYSDLPEDIGNSHTSDKEEEFMLHFRFFADAFVPLIKPGRMTVIHVAQPPRFKGIHGHAGLWDLRGRTIDVMNEAGMQYYGDITIPKNPQAQAIRTKSQQLQFSQLEKDSSVVRPVINDYVLLFRQAGENQVPVTPDCSRDEWIDWASGIWHGIRETEVLNTEKGPSDQRHLCALQLGVIDRAVRLWSNKGETVFTPFAGIGSEIYQSILCGRRAFGIELIERHWKTACKNSERATRERDSQAVLPLEAQCI